MPPRRLTLLIIVLLGTTACGGGMTGVIAPTPTPPPPGGIGTVTGSVGVTASALPAAGMPARPARSNAGRPVLVPDQLLVKFRLSASAAQADSVHAQAGGTVVTTAQTGVKTVFAWQDFNGNGVVDTGDSYGTRTGVAISNGITTSGVSVTVQRYSGPALTVN